MRTRGEGIDMVTGAFGNTGSVIAELLAEQGRRVRTLTNHPDRSTDRAASDAASLIDIEPYCFDDPDRLAASFDGVETFYNTYWMRTGEHGNYDALVQRSTALLAAAERAGVERIVHLSVANPSLESRYPYFRAKATVEEAMRGSSMPVAIVRPALMFGGRTALLNNLAWVLRHAPIFGVAGDGQYRVRGVHVDDVARICIEAGARRGVETIDAVGPERLRYLDFVTVVRDLVKSRARIVRMPAWMVLAGSQLLGIVMRDELLTRSELYSTMEGIADTDGPATGRVVLTDWLREHAVELGHNYLNERQHRRVSP